MNRENRNFRRCSEKENPTTIKQDDEATTKTTTAPRNPLADLRGNNLTRNTNYSSLRKSVSTSTCIRSSEITTRPRSTSDVETKVVLHRKLDKVTERRTYYEEVYNSNDDEVFVNAKEHFMKHGPQNKPQCLLKESLSKIEKPISVVRTLQDQAAGEATKKPARKVTLTRRSSSRQSRRLDTNELFLNCLYDSDYFEENYRYTLTLERNFVLRKSSLKEKIDENFRMLVVNWLSYVQQVLEMSEDVFFVAVRLFDFLLINSEIEARKYTLIGMVALWIVNKNLGVPYIKVSKLYALSNRKFSKEQIITVEKDILKAVKFNVNFPEPGTFLFYYLKHEKLENSEVIRYSAMFLLEVFTLLLDFSASLPSILAASALYSVLVKYDRDPTGFLSYVCSHLLEENTFKRFTDELERKVKYLLAYPKISGEIVSKFSSPSKCCVACDFVEE